MKKFLILCLLLISFELQAKTPLISYNIGNVFSTVGESNEAFLKRAGRIMEDLTYKYGFEFCSRIWQNKEKTGLMLNITTVKSQVGCVIPRAVVSENNEWIPLLLTIHTHPQVNASLANASDVLLNAGKYTVGSPISIDNNHFSVIDYAAGPGFLVVREHLLFQHSPNEEIDLGNIDPP